MTVDHQRDRRPEFDLAVRVATQVAAHGVAQARGHRQAQRAERIGGYRVGGAAQARILWEPGSSTDPLGNAVQTAGPQVASSVRARVLISGCGALVSRLSTGSAGAGLEVVGVVLAVGVAFVSCSVGASSCSTGGAFTTTVRVSVVTLPSASSLSTVT